MVPARNYTPRSIYKKEGLYLINNRKHPTVVKSQGDLQIYLLRETAQAAVAMKNKDIIGSIAYYVWDDKYSDSKSDNKFEIIIWQY